MRKRRAKRLGRRFRMQKRPSETFWKPLAHAKTACRTFWKVFRSFFGPPRTLGTSFERADAWFGGVWTGNAQPAGLGAAAGIGDEGGGAAGWPFSAASFLLSDRGWRRSGP
jgi:hypothetical protein